MLKIIIADDHQVVRRGLTFTIDAEKDMRVVGEAQNGAGVLALIKKHKPDVVLMDLQMPEMNGVDALKQIRPEYPDLPILILTSFTDDAHVYAALRAGASGFLLKEMNGDVTTQPIHYPALSFRVARGATRNLSQYCARFLLAGARRNDRLSSYLCISFGTRLSLRHR
jgi:DNA-binding NarL/FixJ family response regulator